MTRASAHPISPRYRWVILMLMLGIQITFSLASQCIPPLAPFLQTELNLNLGQIGLLSSASFVGTAILLLLAGRLVDVIGVRSMMIAGQVVVGAVLILAAFTQSLWHLLLGFFLAGMGTAVAAPTTTKAILTWFSAQARATAVGVKQTGVPIAGFIAALAVPVAALSVGWRTSLVLIGIAILLGGLVTMAMYRDAVPSSPGLVKTDGVWQDIQHVVADRDILIASATAGLYVAVQFGLTTYLMLYLRDVLRYSVVLAGAYLAICQAGGVVGRISWGAVSDRAFGGRRKTVLIVVGSLTAAFCLATALASPMFDPVPMAILVLATGACASGWNALHLSLVSELAGIERAGTAVGSSLTVVYVGMIAGPPLFGAIVDATGRYSLAWLWLAALSVLGAGLMSRVRERPSPEAITLPSWTARGR